jgi:hypothetical protein
MAKEIEEQPTTLKNGIKEYIDKLIMILIFIIFLGK